MSDVPVRPPPPPPPLPAGWTEHQAPSGHVYYFNKETKKSTYTRPVVTAAPPPAPAPLPPPPASLPARPSLGADSAYADLNAGQDAFNAYDPKRQMEDLIFGGAQNLYSRRGSGQSRGGHRGDSRGGHRNSSDRPRHPKDRPKHRHDIPNCAPWVLVRTKLGRRFVWNKDTNESFWKFPPNVMKAVVEYDRMEREKKERKERGEPEEVEEDDGLADIEAGLAAAEEDVEIVEVDGEEGMDEEEEYEEVEVTDDEGGETSHPQKRQRTAEPKTEQPPEDADLAWQLAQMEEMEGMEGDYGEEEYFDEEPPLSEEDCKALFKELLDDTHTNPYTPWDKVLEAGGLYDDERYKALPNMKARKECFDEWSCDKMQYLKEQKSKQQKLDPRIPYLAFLDRYATPKLYWPEFRRKYKKEPELKDAKLPDKEKEKLYREHIKRIGMRSSELKSDLTALLKAQPLAALNRSTTLDTLPSSILTDLRYISLSPSSREPLVETYISTLPPAPEDAAASAEEDAEAAKKREERRRREKALAERERRVEQEKRKQDRDLAYGKGRLREEEMEIERAMKVGKEGLKAHLGAEE
ncbi:uncharacterized protein N0V89_008131 [Didymosphaeria variabile]|uniref:WW domain-containing protein n=1 Tax=Didymosphaeria variabile TaxID=1932322 RepID=A0A9W8XFD5_9PLEO|nr:uncharacterized protein N0V89_008131 [Didymosphaeria variabile]KAJ4349515.1 hypothetical protein N0V89_008131 [Didymosphaeria variabile]